MLIGEVAKQCGLSKEGVRYYESIGLVHSIEKPAGSRMYRYYDEDTLERIKLVLVGKKIGFRLSELKPLLDLYFKGSLSGKKAQSALDDKIDEIDLKIDELKAMRKLLVYKKGIAARKVKGNAVKGC